MPRESLTIVTVTRNDSKGLYKTLDSLLLQTNFDFTWMVIDGSDNSQVNGNMEILKQEMVFPLRYLFRSPKGIYDAMNYAIDELNSAWIIFLNSGDYFYEDSVIDNFHKAIAKSPTCDLAAFSVAISTSSGYIIDVVKPVLKPHRENVYTQMNHQGVFIRSKLVRELGKFDLRFKLAADSDLLDRALARTVPVLFNSVSTTFVLGGQSSTNFLQTVNEIASYRDNMPKGLRLKFVAFKTEVRLKIFNAPENSLIFSLIRFFLANRDVKYRKIIELLKLQD